MTYITALSHLAFKALYPLTNISSFSQSPVTPNPPFNRFDLFFIPQKYMPFHLCISWMIVLYQIRLLQIFFPDSSHKISFFRAEVFSFNEFTTYFFYNYTFGIVARRLSSCPRSYRLSPMVSYRNFIACVLNLDQC